MTVKVTYDSCFISVQGMDFRCPLCLTVVKSGQRHMCKRPRRSSPILADTSKRKGRKGL